MPKPIDYARGCFAAVIAIIVLRSFADPLIATSFPHWSAWKLVAELLIWIGVATPTVLVAIRLFNFAHRRLAGPEAPGGTTTRP